MTATFTKLQTIAVPVSDQDKSKALYEELGLTEHMDAELQPGFRWIELRFPGGDATISLVADRRRLADRDRHRHPAPHP